MAWPGSNPGGSHLQSQLQKQGGNEEIKVLIE